MNTISKITFILSNISYWKKTVANYTGHCIIKVKIHEKYEISFVANKIPAHSTTPMNK